MTHQSRDIYLIALGAVLVAAAYGSAFLPGGAPPAAPWLMVGGIALGFVGFMVLGARRHGARLGRLRWVFAGVFALLVLCFSGALLLPASEGPASTLILGLPPRAALVVLGVGVLPALVLPVAYALTFDTQTLRAGDLESIQEAAKASRRPDA